VELRGVHFGYQDDREVLRGIDLVLEPGTVTAIAGPSGSGKSTLVQLLPRFFDPTRGSVTLGGVDASGCWTARCARSSARPAAPCGRRCPACWA
ncbi:ATP-binding cassette domain-containing protein, partial [Actinomadura darangshiensis]|uniref:ATP-binding cassette domain-containing protein n=1 Tax=Actinomadura darangshiensis TaxID=705336 RepID=UPI001FB7F0DF